MGSLNPLANSMRIEAQFAFFQCVRFRPNLKILHDQPIKNFLKNLKGTAT